MKITRDIDKLTAEITDIHCNKCGMSCKGHAGNFNGLIEVEVVGAYDSTHIDDGDVFLFSLCERCCKSIFDDCKLPPFQYNINDREREQFFDTMLSTAKEDDKP